MSRLFEPQLQGSIQSLASAASKRASCSYRVLSFLQESEHLELPTLAPVGVPAQKAGFSNP